MPVCSTCGKTFQGTYTLETLDRRLYTAPEALMRALFAERFPNGKMLHATATYGHAVAEGQDILLTLDLDYAEIDRLVDAYQPGEGEP